MRLFKKQPHPTFTTSIAELNKFKLLIADTDCPACKQKTLQLNRFIRGPNGWESEASCRNCNFVGVVNNTGFEFKGVSSRGKAKE